MLADGTRSLLVFAGLSLAIHVAAFSQVAPGSLGGSGDNGELLVSLQAAPDSLSALVESWLDAPTVDQIAPTQTAPEPTTAPVVPLAESPIPRTTSDSLSTPHEIEAAPDRQSDAPAFFTPKSATAVPTTPDFDTSGAQPRMPLPEPAPPAPRAELPEIAAAPLRATRRPVPRPQTPKSDPQTAQRATGTGSAPVAGNQGTEQVTKLDATQTRALQAAWSASIQSRIARYQRYPRGNHGDGRVKVQMVILKSGELRDVSLAASSGRAALDAAAIKAVQKAAPFSPAPDGLSDEWYRVAQWMNFRRR
jgi:protein TonB